MSYARYLVVRGGIFCQNPGCFEGKFMPRHLDPADLPEDIARLAQVQVAAGRFATVEDVVRAGVEALQQRQQDEQDWLAYARDETAEGFAELDRGEGVIAGTPDEIMAQIRADVAARRAGPAPK
jgi:Arc/MetJ-type ribon-helix-helix transcriptional regulator